ncbi:hypothetical protein J0X19_13950 [Hymenobacter sp. BT186]|uniref:Uncharacterized protein n=1 Tax=Hymenobacter telluris TaxID=2816474 RepID=A0A939EX57_9BACT|nr:hypothetical protein [Hymenobacter telluris]MBO0359058.1 hypothetical protein [Hymenobacter telluris]MBW3375084.1 hypothetical protein [Hymenobacter norwichensis]
MSASLTQNCTSEAQLEKIIKGQERKFRWRDDWPAMEKALMEAGTAAIRLHEEKKNETPVNLPE